MSFTVLDRMFFQCIDPSLGKIMCQIARRVNPFRAIAGCAHAVRVRLVQIWSLSERLCSASFRVNGFLLVFNLGCQ